MQFNLRYLDLNGQTITGSGISPIQSGLPFSGSFADYSAPSLIDNNGNSQSCKWEFMFAIMHTDSKNKLLTDRYLHVPIQNDDVYVDAFYSKSCTGTSSGGLYTSVSIFTVFIDQGVMPGIGAVASVDPASQYISSSEVKTDVDCKVLPLLTLNGEEFSHWLSPSFQVVQNTATLQISKNTTGLCFAVYSSKVLSEPHVDCKALIYERDQVAKQIQSYYKTNPENRHETFDEINAANTSLLNLTEMLFENGCIILNRARYPYKRS